jgi:multisubunit Na+/H+ antiporter MnhB subunit
MILVDKKILSGGLVMIIVGIIITIAYSDQPIGQSGMTEEEIIDLMISEDQNQAYQMLSGILIGVGFLLVLISFGARRKKDSATRKEKKPAE